MPTVTHEWDRVVDNDHDLVATITGDSAAVKNIGGDVTKVIYPNDNGNLTIVAEVPAACIDSLEQYINDT